MDKIRDVIEEDWKKTEKRFYSINSLGKLYLLSETDSAMLEGPPVADAAVVR